MGGPGGFGRGGRGRGPTDEEREAERKRKMEECKCLKTVANNEYRCLFIFGSLLTGCFVLLPFAVVRKEKTRSWTDARRPQKEEARC